MIIDTIWIWFLVGGITGLLAGILLPHIPAGIAGSVIVGIIGGVVAGLGLSLLRLPISPGIITNAVVAFVGSVLLLAMAQKLL